MKTYSIRPLIVIIIFLLITACTNSNKLHCPDGLETYHKVTLYFGTSYPGGIISDKQWSQFLDEAVTPQLSEGMTVIDTYGQWMRPDSLIVKEPGKVIVHLFKDSNGKAAKIQKVINEFKRRFNAESVIWEEDIICASF